MKTCDYKEIYNTLIVEKSKIAIIEYEPISKVYTYLPYSHSTSSTALDDISNLLIDNMVFYAFSEDEIISLNRNISILDDLRTAAKYAYINRLPQRTNPNTDGTLGEVLLDLLLQVYTPASEKLIARAKYTEIKSKTEITGYDALYFTKEDSIISLWLGQAKAGSKQYCKADIQKDLNTKFTKHYFANTMFYIADRSSPTKIIEVINSINKVCYESIKHNFTPDQKTDALIKVLKDANVQIKIPCLLAYTTDIYDSDNLTKKICNELDKFVNEFDSKIFEIGIDLKINIVFYVFPIKNVPYIRNKIVDLKKEVN